MDWLLIAIILPVGYFLLRILESIILNVVGNILTDPIKNWLASRSLSSKRKRVDQLKKEFEIVTKFHDDKNKLYLSLIQNGLYLMIFIAFFIGALIIVATERIRDTSMSGIWQIVFVAMCILTMATATVYFNSMTTMIERVLKYDEYKKQVEKRILELSNRQPTTIKTG